MTDTLCAVVPFRSIASGKQRLARELSEQQRQRFVAAMLEDTLRTLASVAVIDRVFLLSNDAEAAAIARHHGAVALAEPVATRGLNAVVQASVRELAVEYSSLLIVHGDLPLLQAEELVMMRSAHTQLAASGESALTMASDRHGQGTNCLMCSPPAAMRFYYGTGSLAKHLAFAKANDIQSQVVELDGASLDIDEPADLSCLHNHRLLPAATEVARFLS